MTEGYIIGCFNVTYDKVSAPCIISYCIEATQSIIMCYTHLNTGKACFCSKNFTNQLIVHGNGDSTFTVASNHA